MKYLVKSAVYPQKGRGISGTHDGSDTTLQHESNQDIESTDVSTEDQMIYRYQYICPGSISVSASFSVALFFSW